MLQSVRNFIKWWNRPNKSVLADWTQALVVMLPIVFVVRTYIYGLYIVPSGSMETTMLVGEGYFADKFTYLFSKPKRGDVISFNEPRFPYSKDKFMNWFQHHLWGPQNWTKRVIGIPGDHVQGKIEDGKTAVYLNGKKLDEPYVNKYPLVPASMSPTGAGWQSYDPNYSYQRQPFYRMNGYIVKSAQKMWRDYGYPEIHYPGTPLEKVGKGNDVYDVTLGDKEYWVMGDNRLGSDDSRSWGKLHEDFIHGRIVFRIFSFNIKGASLIFDIIRNPIDFWTRVRWRRFFSILR
jgi:signal peptidase I